MDNTIKNLSKEELLSSFGGCNYKWVVIDQGNRIKIPIVFLGS